MDDVRAVMDAAGSERAALLGISEGVSMSMLFAATYPGPGAGAGLRAAAWRARPRPTTTRSAPPAEALIESGIELLAPYWGEGAMVEVVAPSQADDPELPRFFGRLERASASPGMLAPLVEMFLEIDVRDVVPSVHVPDARAAPPPRPARERAARALAGRAPAEREARRAARRRPHPLVRGPRGRRSARSRSSSPASRAEPEPERILATVLFTDIVDSTRTAAELGDSRWREVLERHQRTVTGALERFGGREVKSTGDGFLATFDGPARAIRCARAILDSSRAATASACAPACTPASAR